MVDELTDQEMTEARALALAMLLADASPRKLVIAGPGTGKTYTFRKLFETGGSSNLVLTFLTRLVRDLEEELGDLAAVYSFHAFAHRILRESAIPGVTRGVDYYPPLDLIYEQDVELLGSPATWKQIREILMNLREASPVLDAVLQCGTYYDAVGYNDSVYRVHQHLQAQPGAVPVYDQIVVDEYQDFSLMETQLIESLARASPILVVGDDDQALYAFRDASAIYLKDIAADDRYTRFELPFCSRCTEVLVDATHHIVEQAQARGLLDDRISKPYFCYRPDKRADSERYPKIVHARCSVENRNAPYMERFLEEAINRIPQADIEESRVGGYPTVLVIGPMPFSREAFDYLEEIFSDVSRNPSEQPEVRAIDGYLRLVKNRTSRLGWRIILHVRQPEGWQAIVHRVLTEGAEIAELLKAGFLEEHLAIVELLLRMSAGEDLTSEEVTRAVDATGLQLAELLAELDLETAEDEPGEVPCPDGDVDDVSKPSILVTSLVGGKGLQASHVFVVGVNDGHFPRRNSAVTEDEVCKLLVALTRARKSCTLVSTGRLGAKELRQSVFVDWLSPYLEEMPINKAHFQS